jgi:hypothetical protein
MRQIDEIEAPLDPAKSCLDAVNAAIDAPIDNSTCALLSSTDVFRNFKSATSPFTRSSFVSRLRNVRR